MVYEFIGRITQVSERSGQSQKGPWKMWEVTMQHDLGGQYPSFVAFEVWDESLSNSIAIYKGSGATVKLSAYINAREYNGRWFNYVRASTVEPIQNNMGGYQHQPMRQAPGYVPQQIPFQQNQYGNAVAPGYAPQQGNSGGFNGVDPNTGLPF